MELVALQQRLPEISSLGATLVAISPERPEHGAETARKNRLTFEVLTDHGNAVARRFGIVYTFSPDLVELYRRGFKNDLLARNGTNAWELPVPATYLIEKTGIIRLAFVDPDHTKRLEPEAILQVLQGLPGV